MSQKKKQVVVHNTKNIHVYIIVYYIQTQKVA